jgi:hypothetical protein
VVSDISGKYEGEEAEESEHLALADIKKLALVAENVFFTR